MLTPEQRDEMLIRIDERQKAMHEKLEIAFSGPPNGFVRHEVYDEDKKNRKWFNRLLTSSVLAVFGKIAFDIFK